MNKKVIALGAAALLIGVAAGTAGIDNATACTRILWNTNKLAVVSARTMDWPESTMPLITALPRGMKRHGGFVGSHVVVAENPAVWISKYGASSRLCMASALPTG